MREIDSGGPAFPVVCENGLGHVTDGLSKREWFAGMAMQGILTRVQIGSPDEIVEWSYKYSDAMLRAGEGGK